jgi:hypothetical protein
VTRELLAQRIKYLIEEGGVLDDPIAELQREVRRLWIAVIGCTILGVLALSFIN